MRRDSKSALTMDTDSQPPGWGRLVAFGRSAGRTAAAAAAATLVLVGCSAGMRLGYNNADTLLLLGAGRYVSLTPEQEALVRERASALVAWHRSTQLRDYVQLTEEARRKVAGPGPITPQDVLAFNDAINARLAVIGERAAPDLARLALTLTPEQVERLQRKFADEAAKEAREQREQQAAVRTVAAGGNGAADRRVEERLAKLVERTDDWFGSVTSEQRALLQAAAQRSVEDQAGWSAERERRQQALLRLLKRLQDERPDEATATAWIRAYFAQLRAPGDAGHRAQVQAMRAANAELLAGLVNAATPEQRAVLSRKLAGFAEDFSALAAARGELAPG